MRDLEEDRKRSCLQATGCEQSGGLEIPYQKKIPRNVGNFCTWQHHLWWYLHSCKGSDSSPMGSAGEEEGADEMNLVCRSEGKLRRWPKCHSPLRGALLQELPKHYAVRQLVPAELWKHDRSHGLTERYCQTWRVVIHLWEHAGSAVWKRFLGHGRGGGVWMPRLQGWINFQDFRWNLTCREFSIFASHHLTFFLIIPRGCYLAVQQQCLLSSLRLPSDAFSCSPSTILHDTSCQLLSSLKKRFVISH